MSIKGETLQIGGLDFNVLVEGEGPDGLPAPDLVQRTFAVDGPNRLWVADITYIATLKKALAD
jgi:transposase InsO family protein